MAPDSAASTPGQARLEEGPQGVSLILTGDWTLMHYTVLDASLAKLTLDDDTPLRLDLQGVGKMDTAGATLLVRLLGAERTQALPDSVPGLTGERRELLLTVCDALRRPVLDIPKSQYAFGDVTAHIGRTSVIIWQDLVTLLDFMGRTLLTFLMVLPRPRRWRLTPLVSHIEQTGLNAVPIVALLTFLVGAVVALLGATVLVDFGLTIYTVDLVTYSFMREFGVLLTAIMLAGRTASAFTAQIGSMKANEELDALRVQGLDPIELLVLPRVLALMVTLPLLTFIAVISGLVGGAVVSLLSLDISLTRYLEIVNAVPLQHFWVGLSKAPLFAFIIGLIGCLEGFKSGASAESVGLHTTSSVVQSIFIVILLDAVSALYFMEAGW
ncbi:MAG: ABC transporter permease [Thiohalophilus sp.]|nr:ABC transporter permease [Thiohalophilus sp.]MDZ7805309.1 ABC transporter permease [Thiohalophilus sp.]